MLIFLAFLLLPFYLFLLFPGAEADDEAHCSPRLGTRIAWDDCVDALRDVATFMTKIRDLQYFQRSSSGEPTDLPRGWTTGTCNILVDLHGARPEPLNSLWTHHNDRLNSVVSKCVFLAGNGGFSVDNGFIYIVTNPAAQHLPLLRCMEQPQIYHSDALQCLLGMTGDELIAADSPARDPPGAMAAGTVQAGQVGGNLGPTAPILTQSEPTSPSIPLEPQPVPLVPSARFRASPVIAADTSSQALPGSGAGSRTSPPRQRIYSRENLVVETSDNRVVWQPWNGDLNWGQRSFTYLRIALKNPQGLFPPDTVPLPDVSAEEIFIRVLRWGHLRKRAVAGAWVSKDGAWTSTPVLRTIISPTKWHFGGPAININVVFSDGNIDVKEPTSTWLAEKRWILLRGPVEPERKRKRPSFEEAASGNLAGGGLAELSSAARNDESSPAIPERTGFSRQPSGQTAPASDPALQPEPYAYNELLGWPNDPGDGLAQYFDF
ncbi:hypothetical protein MMC13_000352 [Lambiella insularis]|nr:hypothetical protein [Lambiella insularis]